MLTAAEKVDALLPLLEEAALACEAAVEVVDRYYGEIRVDLPPAVLYDYDGERYEFEGFYANLYLDTDPPRVELENEDENCQHPHVDGGYVCVAGGYKSRFQVCLERADAYGLLASLLSCINTHNPRSQFRGLGDADNYVICESCDNRVLYDDSWYCESCDRTVCGECIHKCEKCGRQMCHRHIDYYDDKYADGYYCERCYDTLVKNYHMDNDVLCEGCDVWFDINEDDICYRDDLNGHYCDDCYERIKDENMDVPELAKEREIS